MTATYAPTLVAKEGPGVALRTNPAAVAIVSAEELDLAASARGQRAMRSRRGGMGYHGRRPGSLGGLVEEQGDGEDLPAADARARASRPISVELCVFGAPLDPVLALPWAALRSPVPAPKSCPQTVRSLANARGCGAAGSCTVTRSPPAARGVRVRVPSCAWVMLLTIARPRPTPAWSVRMRLVPRRNGSASVATNCGVSFSPVFSTVSTALLG